MKVNSYNLYEEQHPECILFHAIAQDEEHIKIMAQVQKFDIEGLTIEKVREDVRDQIGRPYLETFFDARIF